MFPDLSRSNGDSCSLQTTNASFPTPALAQQEQQLFSTAEIVAHL